MRQVHLFTGLLLAVLISSVAVAALTGGPTSDATLIAEIRDEWSQAINGRQLEELVALYAEGSVLMPQYVAPQLGREAISAWYAAHFARIDALYDYSAETLQVGRRWAFETFTIAITLTPSGDEGLMVSSDTVQTFTRGTRVYRKDRAGAWHIDREVWDGLQPAGAFVTSVLLRACTPHAC